MHHEFHSVIIAKVGALFTAAVGLQHSPGIASALGSAPPEWWHLLSEGGPVALMLAGVYFLWQDRQRMISEMKTKSDAMESLHRELVERMDRHAERLLRLAETTDQDIHKLMQSSSEYIIENGQLKAVKPQGKLSP